MIATPHNAPLWGKITELAVRWLRRHDRDQLATEYDTRRLAHNAQAAELAAQVDPALYAEVLRTAARAEQARIALEACQYDCDIVPGVPGLTWEENQARLRRVSAARKNLPDLETASRVAQSAYEQARAALESAVGTLCAPAAAGAARRVPEAERAAQQLIRDAKEDARWAACLPGAVLERVTHAQETAQ